MLFPRSKSFLCYLSHGLSKSLRLVKDSFAKVPMLTRIDLPNF